jgi:hypothetical protein
MNIYEKLQECRVQLKNKDLKQTGQNKFSNYTYFELGDFLPHAMDIMKAVKLTSVFGFASDKATLTIIDVEKPEETITFESPSLITEMKGSNPIQNIGASQTYMRRYLYMMAFELSEFDMVNPIDPKENEEEAERKKAEEEKQNTLKRQINDIEYDAFQQAVEETSSDIDILFKTIKYVGTPEEMTWGVWRQAMDKIEAKKEKMAKTKKPEQSKLDL